MAARGARNLDRSPPFVRPPRDAAPRRATPAPTPPPPPPPPGMKSPIRVAAPPARPAANSQNAGWHKRGDRARPSSTSIKQSIHQSIQRTTDSVCFGWRVRPKSYEKLGTCGDSTNGALSPCRRASTNRLKQPKRALPGFVQTQSARVRASIDQFMRAYARIAAPSIHRWIDRSMDPPVRCGCGLGVAIDVHANLGFARARARRRRLHAERPARPRGVLFCFCFCFRFCFLFL